MASTAENKQLSHQAGIEMTFEKSVPNNEEGQTEFPNTKSVILIMIALYLAIFLVALVCPSAQDKAHEEIAH